MADVRFGEGGLKAVTVIGPLFASAIAVFYDVGFFFGTDISFFTFFSFTEHLVFALQSIPFAGPAAFMILTPLIGIWYSLVKTPQEIAAFVEKYRAMPADEQASTVAKLNKRIASHKKWNPYVQAAISILAVPNALLGNYTTSFLIVISVAVTQLAYPIEKLKSRNIVYLIAAMLGFGSLISAFLVGVERSNAILKSNTPSERVVIEGDEIPSRIVRAGDRGLLFFSLSDKRLKFVRWER